MKIIYEQIKMESSWYWNDIIYDIIISIKRYVFAAYNIYDVIIDWVVLIS